MRSFQDEFKSLLYILTKSSRVLLFAHSRPDADSVGANAALAQYLRELGKECRIACYDPYPDALKSLHEETFYHPDQLNLMEFDAVIACDSVDRGYHLLAPHIPAHVATVLVDHHPDITVSGDVVIIDTAFSSSCEILYLFFQSNSLSISKHVATLLLMGILFDTGGFQHSNVSPRVMNIASELVKLGAPLSKITQTIFSHKNISALRLWGRAFEKARLNPKNGMIVTAITHDDFAACEASPDDIYQVASILSAVPDAKFALVLSERENNIVRASLRSSERHLVDVAAIAKQFGGGGHKLASGFELPGKITETANGWQII